MYIDYELIHKIKKNEKLIKKLTKMICSLPIDNDENVNKILRNIITEEQKLISYQSELIDELKYNIKDACEEMNGIWKLNKRRYIEIVFINIKMCIKGLFF